MGTPAVIPLPLSAQVLALTSGFVAYDALTYKSEAKWDYLSFAAPSIGALIAVDGYIDRRLWFRTHLWAKRDVPFVFLSLLTIPVALFGYIASQPVQNIGFWMTRTVYFMIWTAVEAEVTFDTSRTTLRDMVFVLAWFASLGAAFLMLLSY
jgi:hypothetical protein